MSVHLCSSGAPPNLTHPTAHEDVEMNTSSIPAAIAGGSMHGTLQPAAAAETAVEPTSSPTASLAKNPSSANPADTEDVLEVEEEWGQRLRGRRSMQPTSAHLPKAVDPGRPTPAVGAKLEGGTSTVAPARKRAKSLPVSVAPKAPASPGVASTAQEQREVSDSSSSSSSSSSSDDDDTDAIESVVPTNKQKNSTAGSGPSAPPIRRKQKQLSSDSDPTGVIKLYLTQNGGLCTANGAPVDEPPVQVSIPRPGSTSPLLLDGAAFCDLVSVYHILRGFSWLLRLSPFSLQDLCVAVASGRPSSLLDEVHLAILRTLAAHEVAVDRKARRLDLAMLDQVTWPEFVWEWLEMAREKDLSKWATLPFPLAREVNPTEAAAGDPASAGLTAVLTLTDGPPAMMQASAAHVKGPLSPTPSTTPAAASDPPARNKGDMKWSALLASRAVGTRRSSRGSTKEGASDASVPSLADRTSQEAAVSSLDAMAAAEIVPTTSPTETQAAPGVTFGGLETTSALKVAAAAALVHAPDIECSPSQQTASTTATSSSTFVRVAGLKRLPVKAGNAMGHGTSGLGLVEIVGHTALADVAADLGLPKVTSPASAAAAAASSGPLTRNVRRKRSKQPTHFSVDEDEDDWAQLDLTQKMKAQKAGRGVRPGNGLDLSRMALLQSKVTVATSDVQWETAAGGWEQPICGTAYEPVTLRTGLHAKRPRPQQQRGECYTLSFAQNAAILSRLGDDLLDSPMIRAEIDRREAAGMWVSGKGGVGGAWPVRTQKEKDERGKVPVKGHGEDGNMEACVLCTVGGNLICCDSCVGAYHKRCIGESARSLQGVSEWNCPECRVGGRGEAAGLRIPAAGCSTTTGAPTWSAYGCVFAAHTALPALHQAPTRAVIPTQPTPPPATKAGNKSRLSVGFAAATAAASAVAAIRVAVQADRKSDAVLRGLSMVTGSEAELALQAVARPQHRQSEAGKPHPTSLTEVEKGPCSGCDSMASAPLEGYINRYRNSWAPAVVAHKDAVLAEMRRRKSNGSVAGAALLPVPLPLSKFCWPASLGKGQKNYMRCGRCASCLKPLAKKACLTPVMRAGGVALGVSVAAVAGEGEPLQLSKVATLQNYLMKAERDLWGLLGRGWAAPGLAGQEYRRHWASLVKGAANSRELAKPLLDLEEAICRRLPVLPASWDLSQKVLKTPATTAAAPSQLQPKSISLSVNTTPFPTPVSTPFTAPGPAKSRNAFSLPPSKPRNASTPAYPTKQRLVPATAAGKPRPASTPIASSDDVAGSRIRGRPRKGSFPYMMQIRNPSLASFSAAAASAPASTRQVNARTDPQPEPICLDLAAQPAGVQLLCPAESPMMVQNASEDPLQAPENSKPASQILQQPQQQQQLPQPGMLQTDPTPTKQHSSQPDTPACTTASSEAATSGMGPSTARISSQDPACKPVPHAPVGPIVQALAITIVPSISPPPTPFATISPSTLPIPVSTSPNTLVLSSSEVDMDAKQACGISSGDDEPGTKIECSRSSVAIRACISNGGDGGGSGPNGVLQQQHDQQLESAWSTRHGWSWFCTATARANARGCSYLPRSSAGRLARQAGVVPAGMGVRYTEGGLPTLTPRMQWQAAVEGASSSAQFAMQIRILDAAVHWDGGVRKGVGEVGKHPYADAIVMGRRYTPSLEDSKINTVEYLLSNHPAPASCTDLDTPATMLHSAAWESAAAIAAAASLAASSKISEPPHTLEPRSTAVAASSGAATSADSEAATAYADLGWLWVSESQVPMWLIKGYEESVRQAVLRQPALQLNPLHDSDSLDGVVVAESPVLAWVPPPDDHTCQLCGEAHPPCVQSDNKWLGCSTCTRYCHSACSGIPVPPRPTLVQAAAADDVQVPAAPTLCLAASNKLPSLSAAQASESTHTTAAAATLLPLPSEPQAGVDKEADKDMQDPGTVLLATSAAVAITAGADGTEANRADAEEAATKVSETAAAVIPAPEAVAAASQAVAAASLAASFRHDGDASPLQQDSHMPDSLPQASPTKAAAADSAQIASGSGTAPIAVLPQPADALPSTESHAAVQDPSHMEAETGVGHTDPQLAAIVVSNVSSSVTPSSVAGDPILAPVTASAVLVANWQCRICQLAKTHGLQDCIASDGLAEAGDGRVGAPERGPDGELLYCVCRTPWEEDAAGSSSMVGCDLCDNWFHPQCVGLTWEVAAALQCWKCPGCTERTAPRRGIRLSGALKKFGSANAYHNAAAVTGPVTGRHTSLNAAAATTRNSLDALNPDRRSLRARLASGSSGGGATTSGVKAAPGVDARAVRLRARLLVSGKAGWSEDGMDGLEGPHPGRLVAGAEQMDPSLPGAPAVRRRQYLDASAESDPSDSDEGVPSSEGLDGPSWPPAKKRSRQLGSSPSLPHAKSNSQHGSRPVGLTPAPPGHGLVNSRFPIAATRQPGYNTTEVRMSLGMQYVPGPNYPGRSSNGFAQHQGPDAELLHPGSFRSAAHPGAAGTNPEKRQRLLGSLSGGERVMHSQLMQQPQQQQQQQQQQRIRLVLGNPALLQPHHGGPMNAAGGPQFPGSIFRNAGLSAPGVSSLHPSQQQGEQRPRNAGGTFIKLPGMASRLDSTGRGPSVFTNTTSVPGNGTRPPPSRPQQLKQNSTPASEPVFPESTAGEAGWEEGGWRQAMAGVLRVVMKLPEAEAFLSPVNPRHAPGYASFVKRPMDLGTISMGLRRGILSTSAAVVAEVIHVGANCRAYNEPRSGIWKKGEAVQSAFSRFWQAASASLGEQSAEQQPSFAPLQNPSPPSSVVIQKKAVSFPAEDPVKLELPSTGERGPAGHTPADPQPRTTHQRKRPATAIAPCVAAEAAAAVAAPVQSFLIPRSHAPLPHSLVPHDWAARMASALQVLLLLPVAQPFASSQDSPIHGQDAGSTAPAPLRPMDLGIISAKLQRKQYGSLRGVLEDVRTVWANARTLHGPDSERAKQADLARREFAHACADAGLPGVAAVTATAAAAASARSSAAAPHHLDNVSPSSGSLLAPSTFPGLPTIQPATVARVPSTGPPRQMPPVSNSAAAAAAAAAAAGAGASGVSAHTSNGSKRSRTQTRPSDADNDAPQQLHRQRTATNGPVASSAAFSAGSTPSRVAIEHGVPEDWSKVLIEVLRGVMRAQCAEPFSEPVSPEHVPDYATIIKSPMDLGTILGRMRKHTHYATLSAALSDISLVWSNFKLYNAVGHEVRNLGEETQRRFETSADRFSLPFRLPAYQPDRYTV